MRSTSQHSKPDFSPKTTAEEYFVIFQRQRIGIPSIIYTVSPGANRRQAVKRISGRVYEGGCSQSQNFTRLARDPSAKRF